MDWIDASVVVVVAMDGATVVVGLFAGSHQGVGITKMDM